MIDYPAIISYLLDLLFTSIVRVSGEQAREVLLAFLFSLVFLTLYMLLCSARDLFFWFVFRKA